MHGYAICQRNHPQEPAKFGYKYPMANPPVLRLYFFAHGSGDSCLTPFHADVRAFCQHVISEIICHQQAAHGRIITGTLPHNQASAKPQGHTRFDPLAQLI